MHSRQSAQPAWMPASRLVELPGFTLHLGVHPAGSQLTRHAHDQPTICYVMRGRFTEYSGGQAVDCGSGTLKVMPAGEPHSNRFLGVATRGLRIDVDRERLADSPAIARALDERVHLTGGPAAAVARRLLREVDQDDDAARLTTEGLALELLGALTRERLPRITTIPSWARRADDLLREGFPARPSLTDLARQVGVQPATLARGYRAAFGCTIGERVRTLRVEAAARALARSDIPLAEIALQAGFYDQAHFTNVFRRTWGITPAEYRRRG